MIYKEVLVPKDTNTVAHSDVGRKIFKKAGKKTLGIHPFDLHIESIGKVGSFLSCCVYTKSVSLLIWLQFTFFQDSLLMHIFSYYW